MQSIDEVNAARLDKLPQNHTVHNDTGDRGDDTELTKTLTHAEM